VDESKPLASADQDAWVALCTSFRAELAKLVPLVPAMRPDEVKTLADTLQAVMWAHHQAETFDKRTELQLQRISPE
jgi:hypothetical protein